MELSQVSLHSTSPKIIEHAVRRMSPQLPDQECLSRGLMAPLRWPLVFASMTSAIPPPRPHHEPSQTLTSHPGEEKMSAFFRSLTSVGESEASCHREYQPYCSWRWS
jgi:hypothetical protein